MSLRDDLAIAIRDAMRESLHDHPGDDLGANAAAADAVIEHLRALVPEAGPEPYHKDPLPWRHDGAAIVAADGDYVRTLDQSAPAIVHRVNRWEELLAALAVARAEVAELKAKALIAENCILWDTPYPDEAKALDRCYDADSRCEQAEREREDLRDALDSASADAAEALGQEGARLTWPEVLDGIKALHRAKNDWYMRCHELERATESLQPLAAARQAAEDRATKAERERDELLERARAAEQRAEQKGG